MSSYWVLRLDVLLLYVTAILHSLYIETVLSSVPFFFFVKSNSLPNFLFQSGLYINGLTTFELKAITYLLFCKLKILPTKYIMSL